MNMSPVEPPKRHRKPRRPARLHRQRRRLRPVALIPTLMTLGNLVCGFAAIHYASTGLTEAGPWNWTGLTVAGLFVLFGIVLDGLDGSIARMTRSHSEIGVQLDSLGDLVTCGVAPAFITTQMVQVYLGPGTAGDIIGPTADTALAKVVWAVGALYVCCAALRLARFNLQNDVEESDPATFRGLPSPGAAGAIAALVILHQHLFVVKYHGDLGAVSEMFARAAAFGIPFILLLTALAMVSPIRYVHFVKRYLQQSQSLGFIVLVMSALLVATVRFQETLALVFTMYVLSGPVVWLWVRFKGELKADDAQGS